ncbi:MAG: hypothetical protein ACE5PO_03310, partial [Candidatus Bathyarchaeia archaeon]
DEEIVVVDSPGPLPYTFAAGVIFANFCGANVDEFDLDQPLPSYTWYTEAYYDKAGKPMISEIPAMNPGIKIMVLNHCWKGYPYTFFAEHIPTVVVGKPMMDLLNGDSMNRRFMKEATWTEDLDTAMKFASKTAKTDRILIFDGATGGLNVSKPLAELLLEKAPLVDQRVEKELMPKWMRQRGLTSKT